MTAVEKVRDRERRERRRRALARSEQSKREEDTRARSLPHPRAPAPPLPLPLSLLHPCNSPAPLLSPPPPALQQEFGPALKVVKINADPAPGLVEKYKVYGLPTLIIFRDGAPVPGSQREGAINKAKLGDYLASHGLQAGVQA